MTPAASESRERGTIQRRETVEYWCQLVISILSVGAAAVVVAAIVVSAIMGVMR